MKLQQPYKFSDFSGGQADNVNPNLLPTQCVDMAMNLLGDVEIGSMASRLGTSIVGAQLVASVNVLGLFQHVDQADTTKNKLLATVNDGTSPTNSDIYDVTAGTKSLQDDTASLKTYFCNFAGDTLRLNGTDAPKAYNSSSWITSGGVFDLANMPTGYKYPKVFLSRVYLWGKTSSPYTLAYSGVLTSGTVSWTSGNGTIEIEPEDNGGEGTGLGKVPGYLLIFKRRSMHRWDFNSAFPEQLVSIGAYSQESIIEADGLCAFYSDSDEDSKGFYITNGGRPQAISHDTTRPIKKWVDVISSGATVSGWATQRSFNWSVGDLTIDGETWNNVVLSYNRLLNQWSVRTYPSEFKCFAHYVVSGVHTTVGGDDNGTVYRIDKAATYSDNGTAIPYRLRTKSTDFGTGTKKRITDKVVLRGKFLEGASASFVVDEDPATTIPAGSRQWFRKLLSLFGIERDLEATTINVEVVGATNNAQAIIREIELPSVEMMPDYV